MKARELRNLTDEELNQRLQELYRKLFELRSQIKIGRLEKPHEVRMCKRDIARIKTILNERKREREGIKK